ncbi:MAG: DUF2225 domain-containing protein [Selenomonadaceae bacterium]
MEIGNTYVVQKTCPVCGASVPVTKVRSRLIALQTDDDFCVHYKDFNPYYYTVWVCEKCGYAADETHFLSLMPEKKRAIVQEFLKGKKIGIVHQELRTRVEAVAAFKLAIFYADLLHESPGHIAGLYLKMAWLFRESGDKQKENAALEQAANYYDKSLSTERYPLGTLTDVAVMYLIGAIQNRLGNVETATQYLSRIVSDREARTERSIFTKARDLWQDIRERKEREKAAQAAEAAPTSDNAAE